MAIYLSDDFIREHGETLLNVLLTEIENMKWKLDMSKPSNVREYVHQDNLGESGNFEVRHG